MKRNLKIFLLIAVCVITGFCMLHVREEKKNSKYTAKKKKRKRWCFLRPKEKHGIFLRKLLQILMNHR